jgi:hypothetical protein
MTNCSMGAGASEFQPVDELERAIDHGLHGTVHNTAGGALASFDSLIDPIFWRWPDSSFRKTRQSAMAAPIPSRAKRQVQELSTDPVSTHCANPRQI